VSDIAHGGGVGRMSNRVESNGYDGYNGYEYVQTSIILESEIIYSGQVVDNGKVD